ncbi:hypothetical protein ACHAWX_001059 [Stephanocyclus meneghinianus]
MVFCTPMAAAISTGASAGATAFGLKLDKQSVDLTRECFLLQMRQAKRLFTAQWAETAYHHGEAMAQAAQQHAEAQALTAAQYFQTERIHSEDMKLARDQDNRGFEMAWRTEARESLRDELSNQFNRYNTIMLCDAVCMGCIMPLVESGMPPPETSQAHVAIYLFSLGSCLLFFIMSLWFCLTVTRRLHEHTAAILERKLFADTEEIQKVWQDQIENGLPSDSLVMNLLNQAYHEWLRCNINPLGNAAIQALWIGVLFMFLTAGLLQHARYLIELDAPAAVACFWFTVSVAAITVITLKVREECKERRKQGCYDKSWLDIPDTIGPMAKIANAADQLFSHAAVRLGSNDRRDQYKDRERTERAFSAQTEALHAKADSLLSDAERRAKTRTDVLKALTAASEELDALPQDLIANLNDLIHQVNDLDNATATSVTMPSRYFSSEKNSDMDDGGDGSREVEPPKTTPMKAKPIDAHRTAVSLTSLREKLGEIALTTLIRIRNMSEEPLRIKSGFHISRILKSHCLPAEIYHWLLKSQDPASRNLSLAAEKPGSRVTYHLFPIEEIPSRTEVVCVARSEGRNWIPTSGIKGDLIFVNPCQTVSFHISFSNSLNSDGRRCSVNAAVSPGTDVSDGNWRISKEIIDNQKNYEVLVSIGKIQRFGSIRKISPQSSDQHPKGPKEQDQEIQPPLSSLISEGPRSNETDERQTEPSLESRIRGGSSSHALVLGDNRGLNSNTPWMTGALSLQVVGLQALWQEIWCTLTSRAMTFSARRGGNDGMEILLQNVTKVQAIPNYDAMHNYVFDIYSTERKPIRLAAKTIEKRVLWIEKISDAKGRNVADWTLFLSSTEEDSKKSGATGRQRHSMDTETLPV